MQNLPFPTMNPDSMAALGVSVLSQPMFMLVLAAGMIGVLAASTGSLFMAGVAGIILGGGFMVIGAPTWISILVGGSGVLMCTAHVLIRSMDPEPPVVSSSRPVPDPIPEPPRPKPVVRHEKEFAVIKCRHCDVVSPITSPPMMNCPHCTAPLSYEEIGEATVVTYEPV